MSVVAGPLPGSSAAGVAEFVALLRTHDDVLRAFAYRLVGADVDDVLQAAYLAAFRALPEFRGDASLQTWLHRIVYTTGVNHLRSNRRRSEHEQRSSIVSESADVADVAVAHVDLNRAIDALTVDQRAVLLLVDGAGFSYTEAAEILGIEVGTIASRLSRARHSVRSELTVERSPDDI